jgi:hypothetical protein
MIYRKLNVYVTKVVHWIQLADNIVHDGLL